MFPSLTYGYTLPILLLQLFVSCVLHLILLRPPVSLSRFYSPTPHGSWIHSPDWPSVYNQCITSPVCFPAPPQCYVVSVKTGCRGWFGIEPMQCLNSSSKKQDNIVSVKVKNKWVLTEAEHKHRHTWSCGSYPSLALHGPCHHSPLHHAIKVEHRNFVWAYFQTQCNSKLISP